MSLRIGTRRTFQHLNNQQAVRPSWSTSLKMASPADSLCPRRCNRLVMSSLTLMETWCEHMRGLIWRHNLFHAYKAQPGRSPLLCFVLSRGPYDTHYRAAVLAANPTSTRPSLAGVPLYPHHLPSTRPHRRPVPQPPPSPARSQAGEHPSSRAPWPRGAPCPIAYPHPHHRRHRTTACTSCARLTTQCNNAMQQRNATTQCNNAKFGMAIPRRCPSDRADVLAADPTPTRPSLAGVPLYPHQLPSTCTRAVHQPPPPPARSRAPLPPGHLAPTPSPSPPCNRLYIVLPSHYNRNLWQCFPNTVVLISPHSNLNTSYSPSLQPPPVRPVPYTTNPRPFLAACATPPPSLAPQVPYSSSPYASLTYSSGTTSPSYT